MKVIAFVGPSGSGKSYRAAWVAQKAGIEYFIDDGLLIRGNELVAGYSAKKESTKIGSIRRALFRDARHAEEVRRAISRWKPESIMILGTSDKMVDEIANVLQLPPISHTIRIEDIATPEEIERAKHIRKTEGKHVIPVPTFAIKKDFSGYFLDTLQIFNFGRKSNEVFKTTKAVVRPTFSYLGEYHIADRVLLAICYHEAAKVPHVARVSHASLKSSPQGVYLSLELYMYYGGNAKVAAKLAQQAVRNAVENFTSLNVLAVNVTMKGIVLPEKELQ